jgi:pSer/pThr/pTyr-binding forkhead associated (FHA) protein
MTKEEAFQFLDLPENTTKTNLVARYKEKYNFFKMLYTNAPNEVIRNLQKQNLKILEDIKNIIPIEINKNINILDQKTKTKQNKDESEKKNDIISESVLAWAIVHTEQKKIESFPLYEGVNSIGRQEAVGYKSIVIIDDSYLSRYHCSIIISKSLWEISAAVFDDGRFNNGRPSLNGTYLNAKNERIKNTLISNGDTIQIGMTKLVFKWNTSNIKEIENEVENSVFLATIVINI